MLFLLVLRAAKRSQGFKMPSCTARKSPWTPEAEAYTLNQTPYKSLMDPLKGSLKGTRKPCKSLTGIPLRDPLKEPLKEPSRDPLKEPQSPLTPRRTISGRHMPDTCCPHVRPRLQHSGHKWIRPRNDNVGALIIRIGFGGLHIIVIL